MAIFFLLWLLLFAFLPLFSTLLFSMSQKGPAIKLIAGKYSGCTGWINSALQHSDCYIPVIVIKKRGEVAYKKLTKVKHENYVLLAAVKPTSYEEAMLDQHSDIDALLTKLVRKMAECEDVNSNGASDKKFARSS